jgi:hypothetical protein
MKLISAFGAADMLELDRQTVRRALRHVAPDGYEKKQPRWRMKTIIEAVDRHLGRNNIANVPTPATLDAFFNEFDTGCKELDRVPDLEARRRERAASWRCCSNWIRLCVPMLAAIVRTSCVHLCVATSISGSLCGISSGRVNGRKNSAGRCWVQSSVMTTMSHPAGTARS